MLLSVQYAYKMFRKLILGATGGSEPARTIGANNWREQRGFVHGGRVKSTCSSQQWCPAKFNVVGVQLGSDLCKWSDFLKFCYINCISGSPWIPHQILSRNSPRLVRLPTLSDK